MKELTAWGLACALIVGAVTAFHDGLMLGLAKVSLSTLFGVVGVGMALSVVFAFVGGLFVAAAASVTRPWRWAQSAVTAGGVGGLGWWILEPSRRRLFGVYVILLALGIGVSLLCVWLANRTWRGLARGALCAGVLTLWALEHGLLGPSSYLELHHFGHLLWLVASVALAADVRRWCAQWSTKMLACVTAIVLGMAITTLSTVDPVHAHWRVKASAHALGLNGLTRAARALVDLDGDGYSPLAWGPDCDDWDAERHPRAVDPPGGGDTNCNGVDAPINPTAAHYGLTESFGSASLAADIVILISVDTLRHDALHPKLMPETFAFAGRGIRFERMYATSPSTYTSLPLLVQATDASSPVAQILDSHKVASTSISGGVRDIDRRALGFARTLAARNAREVTETALAELAKPRAGRHLFWLHYFDPHAPYTAPDPVPTPPAFPPMPQRYLEVVRYTDVWLGKLYEGLDALGLSERTLVVFTSDHGEAFGEYGQTAHSRTGYDPVLRVPGFVVGPTIPAAVHPHLVTHRDIVPTIRGAFGLDPEETVGRSLLRLRQGPQRPLHKFVFARSSRYASGRAADVPLAVLVEGDHKLVTNLEERTSVLYDLRVPNGEALDIGPSQPELFRRLRKAAMIYADLDQFPVTLRTP